MKAAVYLWWFLFLGYDQPATVVGPFGSQQQCAVIQQWTTAQVRNYGSRVSECWTDEKLPAEKQ